MSGAAKPKATPVDAQTEIDRIMSDIADLQKELDKNHAAQDIAEAAASSGKAGEPSAPAKTQSESPQPAPVAAVTQAEPSDENSALQEFRAGASDAEASLESTLADLGDQPAGQGQSLLDQVLSGEPEVPSEALEQSELAAQEGTEADSDAEEVSTDQSEDLAAEMAEELSEEVVEEVVEDSASFEGDEAEEEPAMSEREIEPSDGTLTLQLQGSMTLKLKYEANGQEVTVGFSDGCLKVTLANGTEFRMPVSGSTPAQGNSAKSAKKARPLRRVA